ncbi:MAG: dienelactone hydrolase family protein [Candidatus Hydrogenedentes bacterium]|nr:dienelactone hydrolase family protein [Candidatus Hydrogenedentota bacterium]
MFKPFQPPDLSDEPDASDQPNYRPTYFRPFRRDWVIAAAVLLAPWVLAEDAAMNPEELGPYPIGVTTVLFEDHARVDEATGKPRALLTEIWYPATDDARDLPKNKLSDFNMKGQNAQLNAALKAVFNIDLAGNDKTFKNLAVRDARVRDGVFPLILFSHGNGGMRTQNTFLCDHLASHGYIVVSPDHTGNCCFTTVDNVMIPMNPAGRDQAAADRPKDISFLIDQMTRFNNGADSRFLGKLDLEHIGVTGHSFGGYTAAAVADTDTRVDAIAPIAAVGRTRTNYDMPVLAILGTEDATIKEEGNTRIRQYYEESKGPHYLVEFKNAGHYSFTDMVKFNPTFGDGVGSGTRIGNGEALTYLDSATTYRLTNGYVMAFFGKYVKGLPGYDAYLGENHFPEELIVKSSPGPISTE